MRRITLASWALGSLIALRAAPAPCQDAPLAAAPGAASPASDTAAPLPLSETLIGSAKASYEAAKLLYGDGDFGGAVLKFQSAYDESRDPRLLWNMAAAEKNLRHYARVANLVTRYVEESGVRLSAEDRVEAETLLTTIKGFIGSLTLTIHPDGALVSVDETDVGVSPLKGPLSLDMGGRRIRVRKAGFVDFSRTEMIQGQSSRLIDVTLEAEVQEGRLRIEAGAGASIRVDDKLMGLGQWSGRLPSGVHRVAVTREGMRPYRTDVRVADGQDQALRVVLDPVDPADRRKSLLPTWAWVAGGGVLATGLGVGAYFAFRPDDRVPVQGSLDTVRLPLPGARF